MSQPTPAHTSDLSMIFIPFMVGTISLILFLSTRSQYLAGRVRELAKELRESKDKKWRNHILRQIDCFLWRYMISNWALMFSIGAVVCFGFMIASHSVLPRILTFPLHDAVTSVCCVLGGIFGVVATVITVAETALARKSIRDHVTASLETIGEGDEAWDTESHSVVKRLRS